MGVNCLQSSLEEVEGEADVATSQLVVRVLRMRTFLPIERALQKTKLSLPAEQELQIRRQKSSTALVAPQVLGLDRDQVDLVEASHLVVLA